MAKLLLIKCWLTSDDHYFSCLCDVVKHELWKG